MAQAVHLRAEAFTQSPDDARDIIDKVSVYAALTHAAETSVGTRGPDADVKTFFASLQIKQEGDRALLTASSTRSKTARASSKKVFPAAVSRSAFALRSNNKNPISSSKS